MNIKANMLRIKITNDKVVSVLLIDGSKNNKIIKFIISHIFSREKILDMKPRVPFK